MKLTMTAMSGLIRRFPIQLFIVSVMFAAALAGCRQSADTEGSHKRIGVTLLTVQDKFYQDLRAGLEAEAAKHGYELLISAAERNPDRQSNQNNQKGITKTHGGDGNEASPGVSPQVSPAQPPNNHLGLRREASEKIPLGKGISRRSSR